MHEGRPFCFYIFFADGLVIYRQSVELVDQARLEAFPVTQLIHVGMLATDRGVIGKIKSADSLLSRELYGWRAEQGISS